MLNKLIQNADRHLKEIRKIMHGQNGNINGNMNCLKITKDLWDIIKWANIHIMGVSKGKKGWGEAENLKK